MNARQPNIILITVDSLRADHLGCYGYTRPTSPNIDHFASDSFLFTHAFSSGPNTPHAFPAIMACRNSLMAKRLGLFDAPLTLAEFLQSTGYATIAFNAANPYISRFFHYDRGFDEFYDYLDFSIPTEKSKTAASEFINSPNASILDNEPCLNITLPDLDLEHYLISEENIRRKACLESAINSDIFERLQRVAGQAFFLWIHYMDTHYPYLPQLIPQQELGIRPISKEENFKLAYNEIDDVLIY
ncbi:MAG: sulfatase-like hydrolase/transferase, partial [bacterium]